MRIAVIADIHGNSAALRAVLEDIDRRGADKIVNLGDSISGPLDPVGTAEILMPLDLPTVAGNHDRWLLDQPPEKQPLWEQWTYPHLSKKHLDWVAAMPATLEVEGVLLSHGTPDSDTQDWLHLRGEDREMREAHLWEAEAHAKGHNNPVLLSGHTHLARLVRLTDGRLLVNPGSVGCPAYLDTRFDPPLVCEAGSPDARYAVIERVDGVWNASLRAVAYDASEMIDRARGNGADDWAQALMTGWTRPSV